MLLLGFPGGSSGGDKSPGLLMQETQEMGFDLWLRKVPGRRAWQPTPVFLSGESHGQRSLEGYSLEVT